MRNQGLFLTIALTLLIFGLAPQSRSLAQGGFGAIYKSVSETPSDTAIPTPTASTPSLETKTSSAAPSMGMVMDRMDRAQVNFESLLRHLPQLPQAVSQTLKSTGEAGSLAWIPRAFLTTLVSTILGLIAFFYVQRWGERKLRELGKVEHVYRADRLAFLFSRSLIMGLAILVFLGVSALVMLAIGGGSAGGKQTLLAFTSSVALFLVLRIVYRNLLVPNHSNLRLVSLSDDDAANIYGSLVRATGIAAIAFAILNWVVLLGLPEEFAKLVRLFSAFLSCVLLIYLALRYKTPIAGLIRGQDGQEISSFRRLLADGWHLVACGYFIVALMVTCLRLLLDMPDATGLVVAPFGALLVAVVAYGLLLLVVDRLALPHLDTEKQQVALRDEIQRKELAAGEEADPEATLSQAQAEASEREADRKPFRDLLSHGAAILAVFAGIYTLAEMWGTPFAGKGSIIGNTIEVLLICFLAYMAYEAVKIAIDRQIEKEQGGGEEKDEEAEIGGAGDSRIATLLPIFRNFLLITIVVIAAMVALSEMGVNIAPLFAGAGVVGLAVGFGAQTLIRDIFSGAFYLIDDAFRKGEYIDIGDAKGTVEKISIRSMKLRHHRGALTTVPFGEIQRVENYSRDWAIMKLAFRVTYDTDVDKMRKIIKKFGQELLADEYYGPLFLQPLKSQGIMSMEDSAMIARVKFTSKPGKQFELRKVIYAGLQELFEENGIKFAHRQVTVRVASPEDGEEEQPSKAAIEAAAGAAAQASIDAEEEANGEGNGHS